MEEKRRFRRVSFREPVQYHVDDSDTFGGCLACDVSEGGIRFNFNDFIPLSARLALNFTIKAGEILNVIGQVAWVQKIPHCDNYQVGVEFSDASTYAQVKRALHQYVESFQS